MTYSLFRISRVLYEIITPVSYTHLDVYKRQSKYQAKVKQLLKEITFIDDRRKRYLVESNPMAPNFKCQLKFQKRERPVRPIVSFIKLLRISCLKK